MSDDNAKLIAEYPDYEDGQEYEAGTVVVYKGKLAKTSRAGLHDVKTGHIVKAARTAPAWTQETSPAAKGAAARKANERRRVAELVDADVSSIPALAKKARQLGLDATAARALDVAYAATLLTASDPNNPRQVHAMRLLKEMSEGKEESEASGGAVNIGQINITLEQLRSDLGIEEEAGQPAAAHEIIEGEARPAGKEGAGHHGEA